MSDHVYGGMTRPPTVAGVPQIVFAGLLIVSILAMVIPVLFRQPYILSLGGLAFGVLGYITVRFLCERDHNLFSYLYVRMLFNLKAPGRKLPGGMRTHAKSPTRKR